MGEQCRRSRCLISGSLLLLCAACSQQEGPPLARQAEGRYEVVEGVPLPTPRGGHAAGMVRGHVVVAGGTNWTADRTRKEWLASCDVFRDGAWTRGPALPHAVAYPMSAYDGGGLYLAGGVDEGRTLSSVYRLSDVGPQAAWTPLAPLPEPLSAGAAAIAGGRLYVIGGERDQVPSTRCYSLALDQPGAVWREEPPLPGPGRAFSACVRVGGRIYLLGGIAAWEPLEPLADACRFDVQRGTWETLPELPWRGYAWSAVPIGPARVLIAGRADGQIHADLHVLDLHTAESRLIGQAVIQTTTAPLIQVAPQEWWLIGGEPDSNKTRTPRVSVIRRVDPALVHASPPAGTAGPPTRGF